MLQFRNALEVIVECSKMLQKPIFICMLFGNISGMLINCNDIIKAHTKGLPKDAKSQLWVGAWCRGYSANLIAVDEIYLHTGEHNLWDVLYLSNNPIMTCLLNLKVEVLSTDITLLINSDSSLSQSRVCALDV